MTNQPSHNLKEEFKKWLEIKRYKKSTINNYVCKINQICAKHLNTRDWNELSQNFSSILALYYELANKEYYLDRVTIRYAIKYFDGLISSIYNNKVKSHINVKLYVFYGKKNYFAYETNLYNLPYSLSIINEMYYQQNNPSIKNNETLFADDTISRFWYLSQKQHFQPEAIKNMAIHLVYENKSSMAKVALLKYYLFLQKKQLSGINLVNINFITNQIKKNNPNKTIHGHYKIIQQISGCQPLIIKEENENDRLDLNFTLTKVDLTKIFNLNIATVNQLLKKSKLITNKTVKYEQKDYELGKKIASYVNKNNVIIEYETELRTYYNVNDINEYLKNHHHYHPCSLSKNGANYNKKGYKYWINRKDALQILGIGKTSFYKYLYNENNKIPFTYLAYTPETTRYYTPEMKKVAQNFIFRKIKKFK